MKGAVSQRGGINSSRSAPSAMWSEGQMWLGSRGSTKLWGAAVVAGRAVVLASAAAAGGMGMDDAATGARWVEAASEPPPVV